MREEEVDKYLYYIWIYFIVAWILSLFSYIILIPLVTIPMSIPIFFGYILSINFGIKIREYLESKERKWLLLAFIVPIVSVICNFCINVLVASFYGDSEEDLLEYFSTILILDAVITLITYAIPPILIHHIRKLRKISSKLSSLHSKIFSGIQNIEKYFSQFDEEIFSLNVFPHEEKDKILSLAENLEKKFQILKSSAFQEGKYQELFHEYEILEKEFNKFKEKIENEIQKRANQFNINILLQKKEVNKGIWNKNFLILENNGMTAIKNIKISFDGDVEVNGLEKINELKPKERKSIAFSIKSNEDGEIPVKIIAGFEAIGKEQKLAKNEWLSVKPAAYAAYGIKETAEEEQKIRERVEEIYPKTENEPPFRYGDFFSYKILNKIGSGGFCNVFLVKAKGKEYAMKIPKGLDISGGDTVYLDENDLKNYEREAKVWAMLTEKFPNDVIKLIDAGIQPFPWFVMELADTSLRQKMKSMKDKEKIDLIINLLDKLDRIHHYGVVHRDLKPENILFVNKKEKLTDFGLAKIVTKSSRSAISSGTPDYMAPEQVSSKRYGDVDWRTDIWQIGVVAYELLTNETPFKGDSYEEIGMAILFNDPLPLTEYGHDKEISNAIMNALQKNKEERYQSATEFKNELRKIL